MAASHHVKDDPIKILWIWNEHVKTWLFCLRAHQVLNRTKQNLYGIPLNLRECDRARSWRNKAKDTLKAVQNLSKRESRLRFLREMERALSSWRCLKQVYPKSVSWINIQEYLRQEYQNICAHPWIIWIIESLNHVSIALVALVQLGIPSYPGCITPWCLLAWLRSTCSCANVHWQAHFCIWCLSCLLS